MRACSLVLVLLAAAAAGVPPALAWTDCAAGAATLFKVSDVTLQPQPIHPGDTAEFLITAESAAAVNNGTVQMIVHYAGLPIWTQLDNLCQKTTCPVKPGPVEVRYTQPFPIITPPGSYVVTLDGRDGGGRLFCVSVEFQVVPPSAAELATAWKAALEGGGAEQLLSTHRKLLS